MKVFTLCNAHKEGVRVVTSISHYLVCPPYFSFYSVQRKSFLLYITTYYIAIALCFLGATIFSIIILAWFNGCGCACSDQVASYSNYCGRSIVVAYTSWFYCLLIVSLFLVLYLWIYCISGGLYFYYCKVIIIIINTSGLWFLLGVLLKLSSIWSLIIEDFILQ